jgi:hypothetical protein
MENFPAVVWPWPCLLAYMSTTNLPEAKRASSMQGWRPHWSLWADCLENVYSFLPHVIFKSAQIQDSLWIFVTGLFFLQWKAVSPMPSPEAGGPRLVVCPHPEDTPCRDDMGSKQCKWGWSEQGIIIGQHGVSDKPLSDVCRFWRGFWFCE